MTGTRDRNPRLPRRIGLGIVTIGAVSLVPWIAYLAVNLPTTYSADNWNVAWAGFDVLLLALLGTTAVLGYRRHPLVAVTAFSTGVLLLCDAWLDVTTSSGTDHTWAIVTALVVELPLAVFLLVSSVRSLAELSASRPATAIPHADKSAKGLGTASSRSLV